MKKYNGFTLIELMIVIVVIGILASMMMIASNESVSTAKASNIVSNLRNFSMAAMALYTDKMDKNTYVKAPESVTDIPEEDLAPYLHNEGNIPDRAQYYVKIDTDNTWWAMYKLTDADKTRVRDKLAGRAEGAALVGTDNDTPPTKGSGNKYPQFTDSHTHVWLKIRSSKR